MVTRDRSSPSPWQLDRKRDQVPFAALDATQLIAPAIAAAAGLLGVWIGALSTERAQQRSRAHQFRRAQLERFYGPMIALRTQTRILSELRVRVGAVADTAWREGVSGLSVDGVERFRDASKDAFHRIIEDENAQLRDLLLPNYNSMVRMFVSRYWLAEPSTREHLPALIEFVDVWRRWQAGSLPAEVLERLDHREDKLYPLYDDLAAHLDRLRGELASGR